MTRLAFASARALAPGLVLAAALALVAYGLNQIEPRISALVAALLLAIVVANVAGRRAVLAPGARFASRRILRLGIVLLGLRISLQLIVDVGWRGVLVAVAAVGFTLPFSVWFGRRLGVSPALSLLLGAGCGICGAAAVVAMEPVAEARDEEAGFALAAVTALGTISMLAIPVLGTRVLDLSDGNFGLWAGGSVHEVAQVVAAAAGVSASALAVATIVKLTRVVLLVPVIVVTAVHQGARERAARQPDPAVRGAVPGDGRDPVDGLSCRPPPSAARPTSTPRSWRGRWPGSGSTIDVPSLLRLGGRPFLLGATASALLAAVVLGLVAATS